MRARRLAPGIWLLFVIACALVVSRTPIRTDMAAFLPRSSSPAQQVLAEVASKGAASHLILIALEGAPPSALAALSEAMADRLRRQMAFDEVANGDDKSFSGIEKFVWRNRYLLNADVAANRFTVAALHARLESDLGLLSSDLGGLIQQSLPSDPTGELLTLLHDLGGAVTPSNRDGVWFSADGSRALLLIYTRAAGFDINSQQDALALIHGAFTHARHVVPGTAAVRLLESGPGVFAVDARDATERDAARLSLLAVAVVAGLLTFAYRSLWVLLLGLLPVASGAVAAIAAVSLGFGFVHGITLGFGVTLIGESVDYTIYLFTQTVHGESVRDTIVRIWPVLRLGALTSIVGFSAMLLSGFVGFAQLGLFSIIGLIVAAGVTRFVLPHLVPSAFFAQGTEILAKPLLVVIQRQRLMQLVIAIVTFVAVIILASHRGGFWDKTLSDMSPIPTRAQLLDRTLRHDLGVPDLRFFAVFRAENEERALEKSDTLAITLRRLVAARLLGGFDVPSRVLPSEKAQRKRQEALPTPGVLRHRFDRALIGLPFRSDSFDPFFRDVAAAKSASLLTPANLPPVLRLQLDSMLVRRHDGWVVIAPLRAVADAGAVAAEIAATGLPGVAFVDLNRASNLLLQIFENEAVELASIGSIAILILLLIGLRSPVRVIAVMAPLAASVIVTASLITLDGAKVSIFEVFGFLLIVAVGSNYCLFFERLEPDAHVRSQSVASIVLANLCTVSAYGLMSLSHIPLLHDIGTTVAIGTFLNLFFSAAISTHGAIAHLATASKRGQKVSWPRGRRDHLPSP